MDETIYVILKLQFDLEVWFSIFLLTFNGNSMSNSKLTEISVILRQKFSLSV